jgi:hypothetical protein
VRESRLIVITEGELNSTAPEVSAVDQAKPCLRFVTEGFLVRSLAQEARACAFKHF